MNPKERAVLLFLIVVLIAGAGASAWRHNRRQRNLKAIQIEVARDSTLDPNPPPPGQSLNPRVLEPSGHLIDLNSASAAELDLLPGIGPALAQRIIEYREQHGGFKDKAELNQVSGIGPKKFAAIKDRVTAGRR
jgi:competence ComEA-like helix-hairpin-helix protein